MNLKRIWRPLATMTLLGGTAAFGLPHPVAAGKDYPYHPYPKKTVTVTTTATVTTAATVTVTATRTVTVTKTVTKKIWLHWPWEKKH
jgi:hypothetical protein